MRKKSSVNVVKPVVIKFEDKNLRLTSEWLRKQMDANTLKSDGWIEATLKFESFIGGKLLLLNTYEDNATKLVLQVKDNHLLVRCSCGNTKPTICVHAYRGLHSIIWHLGNQYFEKLQTGGMMPLAFAHGRYFDKKESTAGLDVSPRPELKSIYRLAPEPKKLDLAAILRLPGTIAQTEVLSASHNRPIVQNNMPQGEALVYMILLPMRHRVLPAVIPCTGTPVKSRKEIKTFGQFLSGTQKQYSSFLTASQKELNGVCFQLWKSIEKMPSYLLNELLVRKLEEAYLAIYNAWQKIILLLQSQPYVYGYYTFGARELKRRPLKKRTRPIIVSLKQPELRFSLSEKDVFYRLEMLVYIDGRLLSSYDAARTLFIFHEDMLYMLGSLRDAMMAEWMARAGGWVTVFKEHFADFEKDWLNPLRANYPVEIIAVKNTKKQVL
ncbi:MAG TPA: hypothetical protein VG738_12550 [Chitinophagaceae bacterium]|nr:hypothetical protein [Chitinophagaceae bacterium]